jgi:hypothetical protein
MDITKEVLRKSHRLRQLAHYREEDLRYSRIIDKKESPNSRVDHALPQFGKVQDGRLN